MQYIILLLLSVFLRTGLIAQPETKLIIRKHYSIELPAKWQVDSSGLVGSDLFLLAPVADQDPFRDNVNVLLQQIGTMNLAAYQQLTEDQISNVPGVKMFQSNIIEEKGTKVYHLHFSFEMEGKQLTSRSVCRILDGTAFLVTYTAASADFDKYLLDATFILQSFKFK